MILKAGIIGLPNVGKSTLFSTITKKNVLIANYPFATIDANVGIFPICDQRLDFLASYFKSEKKVTNVFTFVDIAGLVKGASHGEGLGNKFLHHIRNVHLLCHVVRCFEDVKITNTQKEINPINDIEIINLELILADLEIVTKRYQKVEKEFKSKQTKELKEEKEMLILLKKKLNQNFLLKNCSLKEKIYQYGFSIGLITIKPMIYIANVDEKSFLEKKTNQYVDQIKNYLNQNDVIIKMCIKFEYQLQKIEEGETKKQLMELYQLQKNNINLLVSKARSYLNLCTFFTASQKEVRGWTFTKNTEAKEVARTIHSDISRGFIAVEVYNVIDLIKDRDFKILKKNGKYRTEGKTYLIKDGDVCFFKFNV